VIRVLLADDEHLTREAVAALLDLEPDLNVVAQASDSSGALEAILSHRPDVAVLDVEMPGGGGLEIAEKVAARRGLGVKCVMLTRHARPGVLRRALAAGACGFLSKAAPATTLAEAIRRVAAGGRYIDSDMAIDALIGFDCPLTKRELEVLSQVGEQTTTADIADALDLAQGTVRNYLSAAIAKLHARTRNEAAQIARDAGWI
jgi:two-component system response regulator DesR